MTLKPLYLFQIHASDVFSNIHRWIGNSNPVGKYWTLFLIRHVGKNQCDGNSLDIKNTFWNLSYTTT